MKKLVAFIVIVTSLCSCGDTNKNPEGEIKVNSSTSQQEDTVPSLASADYSSLLESYSCDIDIVELAYAMAIDASDIVKTNGEEQVKKTLGLSDAEMDMLKKKEPKNDDECSFEIKGFGIDNFGNDMLITLRSTEMTKAEIQKEIKGFLKRKNDGLEKITKTFIVESDTKDSYIATLLRYGRVIIYNENHDGAFVISYGINNANNDRTPAQQEELTKKVVNLANYLLKKHIQ